jgi:hypothetical protein
MEKKLSLGVKVTQAIQYYRAAAHLSNLGAGSPIKRETSCRL